MLVEEHQMFREQLAQMIVQDPAFRICGEADTVECAMKVIHAQQPDIAIIDISLRGLGRVEAGRGFASTPPGRACAGPVHA